MKARGDGPAFTVMSDFALQLSLLFLLGLLTIKPGSPADVVRPPTITTPIGRERVLENPVCITITAGKVAVDGTEVGTVGTGVCLTAIEHSLARGEATRPVLLRIADGEPFRSYQWLASSLGAREVFCE